MFCSCSLWASVRSSISGALSELLWSLPLPLHCQHLQHLYIRKQGLHMSITIYSISVQLILFRISSHSTQPRRNGYEHCEGSLVHLVKQGTFCYERQQIVSLRQKKRVCSAPAEASLHTNICCLSVQSVRKSCMLFLHCIFTVSNCKFESGWK